MPTSQHKLWACRLTAPRPSEEQAALLMKTVQLGQVTGMLSTPRQANFLNIPESPVVYWLRPVFFTLLQSPYKLKDISEVRIGLSTTDNERFTRCFWEIPISLLGQVDEDRPLLGRWFWYAKGGGYQKWAGLMWFVVDWEHNGQRIKSCIDPHTGQRLWRDRAPEYFFNKGLTYTFIARGSFGTRILEKAIFDVSGSSIFPISNVSSCASLAALTSSHLVSFLLRLTSQDLKFSSGYVANLPLPPKMPLNLLQDIGETCINLKQDLVAQDPTEQIFYEIQSGEVLSLQAILHSLEGLNERIVSNA